MCMNGLDHRAISRRRTESNNAIRPNQDRAGVGQAALGRVELTLGSVDDRNQPTPWLPQMVQPRGAAEQDQMVARALQAVAEREALSGCRAARERAGLTDDALPA
jgi:hypothetical protein